MKKTAMEILNSVQKKEAHKHSDALHGHNLKMVLDAINTALEITDKKISQDKTTLPAFLYEAEGDIFIGFHGDDICTKEWQEYLYSLKEKP